jgi:hypothetical protein
MEIMLIKTGNGLVPADETAKSELSRFQNNEIVPVVIKSTDQRSLEQLRLYWACCGLVANNTDDNNLNHRDKVSEQVKIKLRFVDCWYTFKNEKTGAEQLNIKTKSISFDKLRQAEFNDFMSRALDVLSGYLGCTVDEMIEAVKKDMTVLMIQKAFDGQIIT